MKNFILFFFVLIFVSCEKEELVNTDFDCRDNYKICDLTHDNNDFGFSLFDALNTNSKEENIFISPFSVSTALAMTLNGAGGETRTEMISALKYSGWNKDSLNTAYRDLLKLLPDLDKKVKINNANSIWYRTGFSVLPDFLDINNSFFGAEVRDKDLSNPTSLTEINKWIEDKTEGKIKDVLKVLDPQTVMLLINAIYFKAQWKYEFDINETKVEKFNLENGNQVNVSMMHANKMHLPYYQSSKFSMIDLPYSDSVYTMSILLPNINYKVDDIIKDLNIVNWENMGEKMVNTEIDIAIPKFKLEYKTSLKSVLPDLGMKQAFMPGAADFSGINSINDLFIDDIIHQSFVEVNEAGTEAAAVTVVIINVTSMGNTFYANRPFVFIIRDNKTNGVLFLGKVMNPSKE
jgi:serine protease inhibitor